MRQWSGNSNPPEEGGGPLLKILIVDDEPDICELIHKLIDWKELGLLSLGSCQNGIDAMEIMGVNSANFLILPKMVGMMTFIPVLVIFSMFTGILGGIAASHSTGTGMTPASFEYGLQFYFNEFYIWYSIIKSVVYAFIISSIAAYFGYNVKGGALEVGKASTNAVVMSSIMILLADVILTNLMLT